MEAKNPSWGIREDFKEVVFVLTSEGKKEETGFPQVAVDIQEETLEAEKMALVMLSPVSGDQQIPPRKTFSCTTARSLEMHRPRTL